MVTSALIGALTASIRDVAAVVGAGWPAGTGPSPELAALRDRLGAVSGSSASSWRAVEAGWEGSAADAAHGVTGATTHAIESLAERAGSLGAAAERASDAVTRARARLNDIIDDFERRAAAVDPDLPGAEDLLVAEARRALDEAVDVVERLRAELDAEAAAVRPPPECPCAPAPITPAGSGAPMTSGMGSGAGMGVPAGSGMGSWAGLPMGTPLAAGLGQDRATRRSGRSRAAAEASGTGTAVTLPDGTTVTAPNDVAAEAVRQALTQLGVPYDWGGTTPGVGLDCSGLTQWAYGEAGLDLPRLAQEQDIGAAVGSASLRPGDLAVWDGHVAMIVGEGMMIEAGDPVQLSPIRTDNAGQGFQGFWRPTA